MRLIITASLILILCGWVYSNVRGPIEYQFASRLNTELFECTPNLVNVMLDNPIERAVVSHVKVLQLESGNILAKVYTAFGINYTDFEIDADCRGVKRVS